MTSRTRKKTQLSDDLRTWLKFLRILEERFDEPEVSTASPGFATHPLTGRLFAHPVWKRANASGWRELLGEELDALPPDEALWVIQELAQDLAERGGSPHMKRVLEEKRAKTVQTLQGLGMVDVQRFVDAARRIQTGADARAEKSTEPPSFERYLVERIWVQERVGEIARGFDEHVDPALYDRAVRAMLRRVLFEQHRTQMHPAEAFVDLEHWIVRAADRAQDFARLLEERRVYRRIVQEELSAMLDRIYLRAVEAQGMTSAMPLLGSVDRAPHGAYEHVHYARFSQRSWPALLKHQGRHFLRPEPARDGEQAALARVLAEKRLGRMEQVHETAQARVRRELANAI